MYITCVTAAWLSTAGALRLRGGSLSLQGLNRQGIGGREVFLLGGLPGRRRSGAETKAKDFEQDQDIQVLPQKMNGPLSYSNPPSPPEAEY